MGVSGLRVCLDSCVYTSWRIPIYVSAQSYIRVGECLYRRWRMPVRVGFMVRKLLINHRSTTFQLSTRRVLEDKFTPIL